MGPSVETDIVLGHQKPLKTIGEDEFHQEKYGDFEWDL